jgi:hypothetical protein
MPTERPRRRRSPTATPMAANTPPQPEKDERWWVIVVSSAPELGSGRYGVWDEKPKVTISEDGNTAVIRGNNGSDEPEVYINLRDSLTISVGLIEHFDAQPIGGRQMQNAPTEQQG